MSDFNIIPNEVQPLGPMWQRLPMDVTMEILAYTLMLIPMYNKPGKVMDKNRFAMLTNVGALKKFRLWCFPHSTVIMKAFYQSQDFVFNNGDHLYWAAHSAVAPSFPPHIFRSFLRRIQVTIVLHDFVSIREPGADKATVREIASVDEFMEYCAGARTLRNLTNATTGFSNLDVLDLELIADFRMGNKKAILAIVEAAAFAVRARKVNITVPAPMERYDFFFPRFALLSEIKGLIAVDLVE